MTLTPERIEKIRKRLKAATPGPWFLERDYLSVSTSWTDPEDPHDDGGGWNLALAVDTGPRPHNDASLIANAPSDLAALLAHITAQQERIERLERVLDLACAASVKDCGTCEEWCREGPGLKSGCVVAYRAEAALRGAE
jgi:hypothetical protein